MFAEAEADPSLSKEAFKPIEARLRVALLNAQYQRLQKAEKSLLVVVAGIDGAGKGATVNLLNEWMDPRHIKTLAYGPPEGEELERPWLWRYWKDLPAKGSTGIVFGSWYAQLLRETSRKRPNQDTIEALSAAIRRFEAMLAAEGVQIVKLWFHLSAQAQKARAERLLSSPETSWQVSPADLKVHKKYDRLRNGGQIVINHTDSGHAPWVVIPSADEQLRAARTAEAVLAAMRQRSVPRIPPSFVAHSGPARIIDRLGQLDYEARIDREDYESELGLLQGRLARAARSKKFQDRSLVLVFEGQDAAGKGGAIRRVTHALDARQFDITPVAAPNSYELSRPICGASGASCRAGAASPSSTAPGTVACWSSASRSWPARRLASRLCRDQRLRGTAVGQRRAGAEILAGGHARRAARTLQGTREIAVQELQDHARRLAQPRQVEGIRRRHQRDADAHRRGPRALAPDIGQRQALRPPAGAAPHRRGTGKPTLIRNRRHCP